MFYGKECNYAFSFNSEDDFDVFFVRNEEDTDKDIGNLLSEHFNNVDTCILWAAYKLFFDIKFDWKEIIIQNVDAEIETIFKTQEELMIAMWKTLTDVNIDEDERIEQNWFVFPIGTHREDIWHWFEETFDISVAEDLMGLESEGEY